MDPEFQICPGAPHRLMRIMIVGPTCAGKTTLARSAARLLGLPHVEFDGLFWHPDWKYPSDGETRRRLSKATAGPCWILDGNFLEHKDAVWDRADALVWLDYPMGLTFWRSLKRTVIRCLTHELLWGSNVETWRHSLLSRDSVPLWALKSWRKRKGDYKKIVGSPESEHLKVHRFSNPDDAREWLAALGHAREMKDPNNGWAELDYRAELADVPYSALDFAHSPLTVFYELTRTGSLKCVYSPSEPQPQANPDELSASQTKNLIDQLAEFPKPPLLVLTGGDLFLRPDLFDIIAQARAHEIPVALAPSAVSNLDYATIARLSAAGVKYIDLNIDDADPESHDRFRQLPGNFQETLRVIHRARDQGLPVHIQTTLLTQNLHRLDQIADLLATVGVAEWSVRFPVPTGWAADEPLIAHGQYERAFQALFGQMGQQPFPLQTAEAPHFRRFLSMHGAAETAGLAVPTNDGRGTVFINHRGEIYPNGFLTQKCGQFPTDSIIDTYQNSRLFRTLRDADSLHGKCGFCPFHDLCGGSRARACAVTGDPLAPDPACLRVPEGWQKR